ncbi:hypothetical protein D9758_019069 [Tetrapyrgos nigripes]|uniref:HET-domain-containing protein n=1 Tax=Tetrapyrgos nigripes TaxID=182062 RepID=A0A8H5AQM3_9AGAR|nr:hypothetical protein D9758_019069 [Tetrapyrgos nigripes]
MRLLNTVSLRLKEFDAISVPPYAILSHTWGRHELLFQDFQNLEAAKHKAGYIKVMKACSYAREYNFDWIWIDSCCINKESSAELSEAINSTYQYYQDATVCYAYLSDVVRANENAARLDLKFRRSRWFTRGWTLQELLAPPYVVFLDENWVDIGTKWTLRHVLSSITSIPVGVLVGTELEQASVAQRMSWAATRETTRPEDMAYCLMGIFGINMSPIYGEGSAKAFMRLQQEIIRYSDDRSIFAWSTSHSSSTDELTGLFAKSPADFRLSSEVISSSLEDTSSYSFANNGLHISIPLIPDPIYRQRDPENRYGLYLAFLHCKTRHGEHIAVHLQKKGSQYMRCRPSELVLTSSLPNILRMEEVVISEPLPVNRKGPRRYWNESSLEEYYLKSSLVNDRFISAAVGERLQSLVLPFTGGSLSELGMGKYRSSGEEFTILAGLNQDNIPVFDVVLTNDSPLGFDDHAQRLLKTHTPHYADKHQTLLKDGGLLSLTLRRTSDCIGGLLVLDYIPKEQADVPFYDTTIAPDQLVPKSDFAVPSAVRLAERHSIPWMMHRDSKFDLQLTLQFDCFPPDTIQRRYSRPSYLVSANSASHFVMMYEGSHALFPSFDCAVVFGLNGDTVWTDIVLLSRSGTLETAKDIWGRYVSKEPGQLKGTASVVVDFPCNNWQGVVHRERYELTIDLEKRKTLQLGTHSVNFRWKLLRRVRWAEPETLSHSDTLLSTT